MRTDIFGMAQTTSWQVNRDGTKQCAGKSAGHEKTLMGQLNGVRQVYHAAFLPPDNPHSPIIAGFVKLSAFRLNFPAFPATAHAKPDTCIAHSSNMPDQPEEPMSEHIHHVSDASFKSEVLESPTQVLVDYWAEWCGPCKMIAPILEEVAREYAGKLKIAKLNIDDNQKTPGEYGVRGIPTLILFKGGAVEATKVGALSKSQLTAFIDSNL